MTPRDERNLAELRDALRHATGAKLERLAAELADDDRAGVRDAIDAAQARERGRQAERARLAKLYRLEVQLKEQGYHLIAGVDEVGRGALAGPLSAGACVLPAKPRILNLNDSKQLTPARREELALEIQEVAVCYAVAHVSPADLDGLGMTAALRRAMGEALAALEPQMDHVVVDGRPMGVHANETAVIGGDGRVAAVAAASIIAKVARDALMRSFAPDYPEYGFEINKGYGTAEHLDALRAHGLTPHHRRSFTPCGDMDRLF